MDHTEPIFMRFSRTALGVTVLAIAIFLLALGGLLAPSRFFISYLIAFLFWIGISLGCLAFLMMVNLMNGGWGFAGQRIFAAGARTMPLMALLFIPLLFGMNQLYPWVGGDMLSEELQSQGLRYLTVPFFVIRAVIYFITWIALAFGISRLLYRYDDNEDAQHLRRARQLSAAGVVLFTITASFAAFDWSMSLDPIWFSSLYGWLDLARSGLAAMAFTVLILALVSGQQPLKRFMTQQVVNDYGTLLLATVMLWVYLSFFQFLIMWSGNLPLEVRWYVPRIETAWVSVSLALVILKLALPFILLILPGPKRTLGWLAGVSALLLFTHWLEYYWIVVPNFYPNAISFHWLDLLLPIAAGGLWIAVFMWSLSNHNLAPVNHPDIPEAMLDSSHHSSHQAYESPGVAS